MYKLSLKRVTRTVLASFGALAMAGQAHAAVYSYSLIGGSGATAPNSVLSIDTTAGTGGVIGSAINAAFTGNFSSFTGGAAPTGMFNITISPTSTITTPFTTFTRDDTGHQEMLTFFGDRINLWSVWSSPTTADKLGDYVKDISSSSTSGGSTSGGSTGGTPVPEPGMVGLMGLGAIALVLRRRRAFIHAAA